VRDTIAAEAPSDEALVAVLQRGGGDSKTFGQAYAALLERMLPVICARVNALRGEGAASKGAPDIREDLMQEGMIGFLRAVSAYRPGLGASFRTFASICVSNRVISALRHGKCTAQEFSHELELLESDFAHASNAMMASMDPQDVFCAMEQTRLIMEAMQKDLTALERSVMEGYLAGERYDAIAQRLDISAKSVDNALQRVRKKLKGFL